MKEVQWIPFTRRPDEMKYCVVAKVDDNTSVYHVMQSFQDGIHIELNHVNLQIEMNTAKMVLHVTFLDPVSRALALNGRAPTKWKCERCLTDNDPRGVVCIKCLQARYLHVEQVIGTCLECGGKSNGHLTTCSQLTWD